MNENQSKKNNAALSGRVKEVFVVPLSARREAFALCCMLAVILLLMIVRFSLISKTDTGQMLKSYQRIDGVLQNQAPTLYRSLLSVVGDILFLHEEDGKWPDIDVLKSEALPPFANNFLPPGLKGYAWTFYKQEGWVDYFGVNKNIKEQKDEGIDPLENTFLLRIIDLHSKNHPHPHSGRDNDPKQRYSYQIWMYPEVRSYPGEPLKEKGWKWIVSPNDPNNSGDQEVISEKP